MSIQQFGHVFFSSDILSIFLLIFSLTIFFHSPLLYSCTFFISDWITLPFLETSLYYPFSISAYLACSSMTFLHYCLSSAFTFLWNKAFTCAILGTSKFRLISFSPVCPHLLVANPSIHRYSFSLFYFHVLIFQLSLPFL